jgi:putative transposase
MAPGAPCETGYIESFTSKLRKELLNGEIFISMAEAKHMTDISRNEDNENKPHSGLRYLIPAPVTASCSSADFTSLNR